MLKPFDHCVFRSHSSGAIRSNCGCSLSVRLQRGRFSERCHDDSNSGERDGNSIVSDHRGWRSAAVHGEELRRERHHRSGLRLELGHGFGRHREHKVLDR